MLCEEKKKLIEKIKPLCIYKHHACVGVLAWPSVCGRMSNMKPFLWQPALPGKLLPLSVGNEAFWTLPAYASILIFLLLLLLFEAE